MHTDIRDEMHKLSHDDERRYQLLMRYLRLIEKEKTQRGFLGRLKKKWHDHNKSLNSETWD